MESWQQSVPEGMTTSLNQLKVYKCVHVFMEQTVLSEIHGLHTTFVLCLFVFRCQGIALTNMTSAPPVIWHFPNSDLPQDPASRFQCLFEVKLKWTMEEIEPYIR